MSKTDIYILRGKIIITVAVVLILISSGIEIYNVYGKENNNDYTLVYENINIKDMAATNVSLKEKVEKDSLLEIFSNNETEKPLEILLPNKSDSMAMNMSNRRLWYLPCEVGSISNGISYSHYAIDIISPRGESEAVYPIANGVISGIYTDGAGAKIVTVNHNINGQKYTSQYVHLSRYANNLYVGREVTVNDYLGYMGSTGMATGTHLHLAVLDCSIFDNNDTNCSDLRKFFSYGKKRLSQGFYGPYSVMNIPTSWTSR